MEIVTVLHAFEDGWHKFTSLELPGLYMVVPQQDLEAAYRDMPRAIEELIFADTGMRVSVRPQQTYREHLKTMEPGRPTPQHYAIDRRAA